MRLLMLAAVLLAAACGRQALPDGVTELHGIDGKLPDDDLARLDALIGDAHYVGLGEALHTVGDFTQDRARIIEHLVEKRGFRVVAIEWQRVDGARVESHLADGSGDAREIAAYFSVWANTAFVAFVDWMRAWNVAHPDDRVHFFGFDIQQADADEATLATFLQAAAPADAAGLSSGLAAACPLDHVNLTADGFATCDRLIATVSAYLQANDAALRAAATADAVDEAHLAADSLAAYSRLERYSAAGDQRSAYDARDAAMAEMFLDRRDRTYPDAKIVLWGHDGHVAYDYAAQTAAVANGARLMGTLLRNALGGEYVAIAQIAYRMAMDWPGVGCGPVAFQPGDRNLETMLHALGRPYLLADLQRWPAAGSYATFDAELVPRDQFRALVFLDDAAAMTPVGRPPCKPAQ